MEPVSALIGVMAALPQCIHSAKELYDLRSRYKDASFLITAIYSESMVIAASLSQVQNLLEHDALRSKPQLLETFDRALTGCRVVYGCLEEEVRDLVAKADSDELKFRDRAKFLWKEDTFKELLTQIRGQQSALTLLIQGLQMESIADIRKLVEENSATLDQVVKRSRTLRQSHPQIRVPESLFNYQNMTGSEIDVHSIAKSAGFSFDNEVVNSRAYRKSMASFTSRVEATPVSQCEVKQYELPPYEPPAPQVGYDGISASATERFDVKEAVTPHHDAIGTALPDNLKDALDSIEKDYLPYMPRLTSTAPYLTPLRANTDSDMATQYTEPQLKPSLRSQSEGNILLKQETAPPLPPRRPSDIAAAASKGAQAYNRSPDDDKDISTTPSIFSKVSTTSSLTSHAPSKPKVGLSRKPVRKPLPIRHQISHDILGATRNMTTVAEPSISVSRLHRDEMHNIWVSLVDAERKFVDRMSKFRTMFYNNIVRSWPLLEHHLEAILIGGQLAAINNEMLLLAMESQISRAEDAVCDPSMFETYTHKVNRTYREYCQRMPHAMASLRTTQTMDPKFRPFVNTLGLSLAWFGMGWEDYLKLPLSQLELYADGLQRLANLVARLDEQTALREAERLRYAIEAIKSLRTLGSDILEGAKNRQDMHDLEKRIHTLDSGVFSQLRLLDSGRRIRHQGKMAIKVKGQGPWQAVHVMLLDNFLLWGKAKPRKKSKGDMVMVQGDPIAVGDLQVTTSGEQHQSQKATMFDDIPRGSVVYTILVKSNVVDCKPHMLGALSLKEQKEWLHHLTVATGLSEPLR
ncbi:hypothetical protein CC86DRAFT_60432 [Ophiobolus disseminans]|uniref:DH domain-containing protein n=1 Tax=Ophiobolus disseminans TaxID=1469910 RepID=A0A6A6ZU17_9PLEO|nr:hypothetical protein CC86DRAFT_60432 [Ophiobolus disseminans]